MTLRASLVLLVVLNLGVALWWGLRSDAPTAPAEEAPSGIARLQLLSERPDPRPATSAWQAMPIDSDDGTSSVGLRSKNPYGLSVNFA